MIKLVNVSKYYNSKNVIALGLRKVNLELHINEFVAIVGESGSGKTTLLNVISGIDTYEDGEMYINGEETSYFSTVDKENYRKKYIAFVFQNYNLIDSYTVLQNVEAPLILSGYPTDQVRARATEIIRRVGLEKHIHHKATKLSGGQKQRVVIARALAKDCPIIAADEPTGNLDSASADSILELLHEISKEKLVIMVTHDFEQVKKYATRKIRIFDGEIVEDQDLVQVQKENLPVIPDTDKKIKFFEFVKMALRNLFAVPKKTFLMVLVFSFFAFIVALVYGSFNISATDMSFNYNYYFENTSVSRIIVRKTDKSPLLQADLDELANLGVVQTIIPFDYILDRTSYYYSQATTNDNDDLYVSPMYLPSSVISSSEILLAGRLPQNDNEIVIAFNGDRLNYVDTYLGREFSNESYYYSDTSTTDEDAYTVVGVVNSDEIFMDLSNSYNGAYFILTEDKFYSLADQSYFSYISSSIFETADTAMMINFSYSPFKIDETLADNVIQIPPYSAQFECDSTTYCEFEGTLTNKDFYTENVLTNITFKVSGYNKTNWTEDDNYVMMNSATLAKIVYDDIYQVSVIASTDISVHNLVKDIADIDKTLLSSKYKVFYPFDSSTGSDFTALLLLLTSLGSILLLGASVIGATLFTYVIFKAIINTKLHDYAIFRTIGANQNMIQYFIYLENIFVVLISFLIFVGITIYLKTTAAVGSLFYSLKMYTLGDYFAFFGLVLFMSIFISRKYCKRIFKESVNRVLRAE